MVAEGAASRDVFVVGCGMTKFGRHDDKTLLDLMTDSSVRALDDSGASDRNIDAVYASSMFAGELNHQTAIGSALVDQLALIPAAADRVENGPASGGSAVKNAYCGIASGMYDTVLVTGGEKMQHVPRDVITDYVATMTNMEVEYVHGVTLPSLAGMLARLYMERFGVTEEDLARVAVKNHLNGSKNPYAQIQKPVTLEQIYGSPEADANNPIISDPIRMYHCCPITDGAASVLLTTAEKAREFTDTPIKISGVGQATDRMALQDRKDPTVLEALKVAASKAFKMSKTTAQEMNLAELHDAFTILEIIESEDAGFFEKGTGHKALREGVTALDGQFPINPSGGLKARGHPLGATGVAQIVEMTWQLRGEADGRQVRNAERAFSCNLGGFANNIIAFVLERT
jgi:acetyl-CoA C-acetyltransferase